ncbi:hypothetical protein H6P81_020819 [Aristolochia fimbriata]|uniref:Uncharacterized protein n=1 Tax=Aristolochia fimbriata TaxID=158543 RepID=A0AAV7DWK1_ARIFI|nr:hypothetical protein H6P81_020819 [Aristolochia fimbriata]
MFSACARASVLAPVYGSFQSGPSVVVPGAVDGTGSESKVNYWIKPRRAHPSSRAPGPSVDPRKTGKGKTEGKEGSLSNTAGPGFVWTGRVVSRGPVVVVEVVVPGTRIAKVGQGRSMEGVETRVKGGKWIFGVCPPVGPFDHIYDGDVVSRVVSLRGDERGDVAL